MNDADRDETPGERLDRQFSELLQELRVTQTGIQLLGGFLLILPFQERFAEVGDGLRLVYLGAVATATLATFFILAPVSLHRSLFRTHRKDAVVRVGDALARMGLGLLAVATTLVAALVFGVVLGIGAAWVAAAVAGITCVALWWALPTWIAGRRPAGIPYRTDAPE